MTAIFLCFAALARAQYIELTSKTAKTAIGGPRPIIVKFVSPTCGHCKNMAPAYEEASAMFTDVDFGAVNCVDNRDICEAQKVEGYPTVKLFTANSNEPIEYEGDRSPDSFADFIEKHTSIKAKRPPKVLKDLNAVNFDESIKSYKCSFVTFHSPHCGHCKRFLPTVKSIAAAFVPDTNISIAAVNCQQFNELCNKQDIPGFPTVKLFKGEEVIEYTGNRQADDVAEFINTNCGTERGPDGLLNDKAGIIEAADEIIAEFLKAEDKTEAVEKMKALPGAEFYVKVMNRILAKGQEIVAKDMETMYNILEARKGSMASLDGVKRRFNVFSRFLPHEENATVTEEQPKEL